MTWKHSVECFLAAPLWGECVVETVTIWRSERDYYGVSEKIETDDMRRVRLAVQELVRHAVDPVRPLPSCPPPQVRRLTQRLIQREAVRQRDARCTLELKSWETIECPKPTISCCSRCANAHNVKPIITSRQELRRRSSRFLMFSYNTPIARRYFLYDT